MADRVDPEVFLADLDDDARGHLSRLDDATPVLADVSRADILVWLPVAGTDDFVVCSHRRPINARTVYERDPVGLIVSPADRPPVSQAAIEGDLIDGGVYLPNHARWIRSLAVPVRFRGRTIAVLTREFSPFIEDNPGDLELTCFAVLRRLAQMIADGTYPAEVDADPFDHPPRVGDGLMLLDAGGRIDFASPNAVTALTRLGGGEIVPGSTFAQLGLDAPAIDLALDHRHTHTGEVDSGSVTTAVQCVPLIEGGHVNGALVLVRNITELRRRDRLLMTKDATIAEIHHRVKNNLQTVSSLLRLQSRRLDASEAKEAIDDSVRRIRSIGVVHEILSHRTGDEIPFREILHTLVQLVRDSLVDPSLGVRFRIEGSDAILPSEVTTPLSLVVSELLQNTIDHAFPNRTGRDYEVILDLATTDDEIELVVSDTGPGLPPGFTIDSATGLGLTIVRTLVESELAGTIELGGDRRGAEARLRVPLRPAHTNPSAPSVA